MLAVVPGAYWEPVTAEVDMADMADQGRSNESVSQDGCEQGEGGGKEKVDRRGKMEADESGLAMGTGRIRGLIK